METTSKGRRSGFLLLKGDTIQEGDKNCRVVSPESILIYEALFEMNAWIIALVDFVILQKI